MGLFIRTRLETRRPPPPPSSSLLPPYRPEICCRVVGRNLCLWCCGGQVVRERWRGGYCTSRAAPEEAAAGTAGQGAACMPLGFFFLSLFFFFFPFSLPSPFCSTGPCRPGNPHPSCPPPSTAARRGLGASGSPWAVTGAGRRREAPLRERLGSSLERALGFLGESKNRLFL